MIQSHSRGYIQTVKARKKFVISRDYNFRATTLLAMCAPRYQNTAEKHKQHPGYKHAEQRP